MSVGGGVCISHRHGETKIEGGWMDGRRGDLRKEMLDREARIGCDSRGRRPRGSDGEEKSKQMEDI